MFDEQPELLWPVAPPLCRLYVSRPLRCMHCAPACTALLRRPLGSRSHFSRARLHGAAAAVS